MKKRILAFGDSNTWGWDPSNDLDHPFRRWDDDTRWTGVLQSELGDEWLVINEGLNGRTTVWDDPLEEYRCGKDQLPPIMDTAAPLDLLIIMVGTNDLKGRFGVPPGDIANGAGLLIERALARASDFTDGAPRLLLICPPRLGPVSWHHFADMFGGSEEKSTRLAPLYEAVARKYGAAFLNADALIRSSDLDGLHLDADQHAILGKAVAEKVREIFGA